METKVRKAKTYGEVTSKGRNQLCEDISKHLTKDSSFIDIGSGYGKLVSHVAENLNIKSTGIELCEKKHKVAREINYWSNKRDLINIEHGDILENKELLKNANILFANNVLFGLELNNFILNNFSGIVYFMNFVENKIYSEKINRKWENIEIEVSWLKKPSKVYKINTITNR